MNRVFLYRGAYRRKNASQRFICKLRVGDLILSDSHPQTTWLVLAEPIIENDNVMLYTLSNPRIYVGYTWWQKHTQVETVTLQTISDL